ncbi:MAG: DUF2169 domain-containing protein [Reinekea sp.]|jgi:hypothetical protein
MIDIIPQERLSAHAFPAWSANGEKVWVVAVKASFQYELDGFVTPLPKSEPLTPADAYAENDPEKQAICAASDLVPFKAGSEILLYAHAVSHKPALSIKVKAELKTEQEEWEKELLAIGPRLWKKSIWGMVPGDPEPITDLPITYEYAFGGKHPTKENKVYLPNPVGIGYCGHHKVKANLLPQVESISRLISSPKQKIEPSGFGPISMHWSPRYKKFPDIDEQALINEDFPYMSDLPESLYNCAPEDQQLPNKLSGPASLKLTGLTQGLSKGQPLQLNWTIPEIDLQLIRRQQVQQHALQADTLIVDTRQKQLHMVYRHAISGLPERFQAQVAVQERSDDHAT